MKHKTSDLEGALLDAAVAKAENRPYVIDGYDDERLGQRIEWVMAARPGFQGKEDLGRRRVDRVEFKPSTGWSDGGPIIERERIAIWHCNEEGWAALHPESRGLGGFYPGGGSAGTALDVSDGDGMAGPTALIAAMRAYAASKLGEEVELP